MSIRIENMQFKDHNRAITGILARLLERPSARVIIRVSDEDEANEIRGIINDMVERIQIEFDSSELGPNPFWTPSQLNATDGKVTLEGPYDQIVHAKGIEPPD